MRLRVLGPDNRAQFLELDAASEAEAIRQIVGRGARVLAVESQAGNPKASQPQRAGRFPILLFSQELLALLEAGLNLTEVLAALHAKERRSSTQEVLGNILGALREGKNFSDTLALYPMHFSDVYVATVRASERTGNLPTALARYIGYQTQFDAIRKKLISAAIYPALLLVVGGFVLLFLVGYVVPKFSAVYGSAERDLPWLSTVLIASGQVIHAHWAWFLVGLVAAIGLVIHAIGRPALRRRALELVLSLPMLADKTDEFRLARFYRASSLLLAAGIPLTRALPMVSGLLTEPQQGRLIAARRQVEEGQPLSVALVSQQLASPVAESLIRVGESSGRLADMLERTAAFHDEDFARWVDWTSRIVEPLLMAGIGLVIGTVVVLMYIPIFELAGSLQ